MKGLFIACAMLLVLPCIIGAGNLPDTGQTKCYDDTQEIVCPFPGEDFYGQDANYAPYNPHSYTSLSGGIMLQDNVTGLIWEVKTDDGSIHDKDNTYTWNEAQDVFISALNSQNFGGYSDWRLPTIKELSSLANSNILSPDPLIDTDHFPRFPFYWSSTTYASNPDYVWYVDFFGGHAYYYRKSEDICVRAVRGGQSGPFDDSFNFVDNGDSTITDLETGFMWEVKTNDGGPRDFRNTYNWQQALSYCENLTLAGYSDWRLPNRNELQTVVDYSRYLPSIDPIFAYTVQADYWSSTSLATIPDGGWQVSFDDGVVSAEHYKSEDIYVRAVRGRQCGAIICPVEMIYGEQSEETELLRYFRDDILGRTVEGRELIKLYYLWSPVVVRAMEADQSVKQDVKEIIDKVLAMIE